MPPKDVDSEATSPFDEAWYRGVWGIEVHRHDYVAQYAQQLIDRFGSEMSFLEVGAGCGALVKELRGLGVDAWGIEISQYARDNSCDPEHIKQGDVRAIPFEDKSFDIVHSHGVLQYVPKKDVPKAVKELKRVGLVQMHEIDTTEAEYFDDFSTYEPQAWWDEQFSRGGK